MSVHLGRPRLEPALRSAVLRKTLGRCWYCGEVIDRVHLDHQVARSNGGEDSYENLIPSCQGCNLSKGDKSLEEYRLYISANVPFTVERLIEGIVSQTWFSESWADVEMTNCLRDYLAAVGSRSVVFYGESFTTDIDYCI